MTQTSAQAADAPIAQAEPGYLVDPYMDWAEGEGIPVHLDFGHDLLALETGPWDRYDAKGCFAHTHGRGDFMANYVLEVEPSKKTAAGQAPLRGASSLCSPATARPIVWLPTAKRARSNGVRRRCSPSR